MAEIKFRICGFGSCHGRCPMAEFKLNVIDGPPYHFIERYEDSYGHMVNVMVKSDLPVGRFQEYMNSAHDMMSVLLYTGDVRRQMVFCNNDLNGYCKEIWGPQEEDEDDCWIDRYHLSRLSKWFSEKPCMRGMEQKSATKKWNKIIRWLMSIPREWKPVDGWDSVDIEDIEWLNKDDIDVFSSQCLPKPE